MAVWAACNTCTPVPMPSSRLLMSLARLLRPCAVKNSVGLSSAELTLLPVARSFWVVDSRDAVDCSESRFCRTDAESTILDKLKPFWCELGIPIPPRGLVALGSERRYYPTETFREPENWNPNGTQSSEKSRQGQKRRASFRDLTLSSPCSESMQWRAAALLRRHLYDSEPGEAAMDAVR